MAKRNSIPMVACELYEPDPNAEAQHLESMPHGGYDWRNRSTRDGLEGDRPMPGYSHHHNPDQQHSRSLAAPLSGRATGADVTDEGLSFREPMRADLDDSMR